MGLEETFANIQELNLYLCHNPDCSKLPFSERDNIIANTVSVKIKHARQARQGNFTFCDFKDDVDLYISHGDYMPSEMLFRAVQCFCKTLMGDEKYKNKTMAKLDEIIAKALGYSKITITQARTGTAHFKRFRSLVDKTNIYAFHPGAEKTFRRIYSAYSFYLKTHSSFAEMAPGQRDEFIAKSLRIKKSTVIAVRCGHGAYKTFGGFVANRGNRFGPHIRRKKKPSAL
ncbi:MAG: hypothetical protein HYT16_00090 [DPANN group archaeon]|nr:hypothetical protein [DPANN group archaeon]